MFSRVVPSLVAGKCDVILLGDRQLPVCIFRVKIGTSGSLRGFTYREIKISKSFQRSMLKLSPLDFVNNKATKDCGNYQRIYRTCLFIIIGLKKSIAITFFSTRRDNTEWHFSIYFLELHFKDTILKFETNIPRKGIGRPMSQFLHSVSYLYYIFKLSFCLLCCTKICRTILNYI